MTARASGSRPSASRRLRYGPHPDQWGDLHLPGAEPRRGVVVVVHGGYWQDPYTAELVAPVAEDLAQHGFAVWNLEYRRAGRTGAGGAGGWPATFEDIGTGIDHLAELADAHALDMDRVAFLGHSAGGHLAVWAAGRHRLPPDAPGAGPRVSPRGVVSLAGVLDLAAADRLRLGEDAVRNLMGAAPGRSFHLADPVRALPIGTVVHAVHSPADDTIPFALSADYVAAARAAGDPAELHVVTGDHFAVADPEHQAYRTCRELLERMLPGRPVTTP
ncbi:alpha/beta hydrolase [Kocuria sp. M1R5S2]|uniref:alpha/beta hydrolase n=1 Tax=Kocuria rhizosphaerae TaxID=3376285 RepID=UPI0037A28220